jgi:hypothetical protein
VAGHFCGASASRRTPDVIARLSRAIASLANQQIDARRANLPVP